MGGVSSLTTLLRAPFRAAVLNLAASIPEMPQTTSAYRGKDTWRNNVEFSTARKEADDSPFLFHRLLLLDGSVFRAAALMRPKCSIQFPASLESSEWVGVSRQSSEWVSSARNDGHIQYA